MSTAFPQRGKKNRTCCRPHKILCRLSFSILKIEDNGNHMHVREVNTCRLYRLFMPRPTMHIPSTDGKMSLSSHKGFGGCGSSYHQNTAKQNILQNRGNINLSDKLQMIHYCICPKICGHLTIRGLSRN